MTTKQIAQAVGKDERTVQRWIKKTGDKMTSVGDKMSVAGHGVSADYTLEETCAIIEAGMGPDAAGIFRANASSPLPKAKPITGAYLRELNAAYDKSIITRDDWRRMAGLDSAPENAPVPSLPPPGRPGPKSWHPPIPVIQAFIDECCIREGSMTHLDTERLFYDWQRGQGVKSMIDTRNLFRCLGLMGYATRKKNSVFTVEGLSLRQGSSGEVAV